MENLLGNLTRQQKKKLKKFQENGIPKSLHNPEDVKIRLAKKLANNQNRLN
jgi:hypothetical protein